MAAVRFFKERCGIFRALCYIHQPAKHEERLDGRPRPGDWDLLDRVRRQKQTMKKIEKPAKAKKALTSATSAAILGTPASKPRDNRDGLVKIKPEWVKYREHLIELRERLLAQMSGLAKESAEEMTSYSLHMADSGTDNFDRDFALSLLSSDQDAIYEIEEALKRIEKNTYGICELSGKQIPKNRLDAIPWTRFTVEAQSQLEREGALRQRRLGQLGTVDTTGNVEADEEEEAEEKPAKEKE
jgi:RNA polymerase-binding transcription factor DksA